MNVRDKCNHPQRGLLLTSLAHSVRFIFDDAVQKFVHSERYIKNVGHFVQSRFIQVFTFFKKNKRADQYININETHKHYEEFKSILWYIFFIITENTQLKCEKDHFVPEKEFSFMPGQEENLQWVVFFVCLFTFGNCQM